MPKMATAGGTRFTPASRSAREAHPSVLAGRAEPCEDSRPYAAHDENGKGDDKPATEPRCAGYRSDQEVVEPAAGLLRTCCGELAGADEGDQDCQDEETNAEHSLGAGSRSSELGEHLVDRRTRDRAPSRLGNQPVQQIPKRRWPPTSR